MSWCLLVRSLGRSKTILPQCLDHFLTVLDFYTIQDCRTLANLVQKSDILRQKKWKLITALRKKEEGTTSEKLAIKSSKESIVKEIRLSLLEGDREFALEIISGLACLED